MYSELWIMFETNSYVFRILIYFITFFLKIVVLCFIAPSIIMPNSFALKTYIVILPCPKIERMTGNSMASAEQNDIASMIDSNAASPFPSEVLAFDHAVI